MTIFLAIHDVDQIQAGFYLIVQFATTAQQIHKKT